MRRFVSILAAASLLLQPVAAIGQAVAAFRGPGVPGPVVQVKASDPLPVTCISGCTGGSSGGAVTVTGTVPVTDNGGSLTVDGPLTDAQLRATPVPISGSLTITGGLSNSELRASAVPVSIGGTITTTGTLTDTQLRASAVPVLGPLTDAQLRATTLPVSVGGTVTVTGGLTDTQIRATALPVSISGTATVSISGTPTVTLSGSPTVTVGNASLPVTGTFYQATQPVSLAALPALATGTNAIGSVSVSNLPATQAVSGTVAVSGSVAVTGPLTDTQIRATALPVTLTSTTLTGTSAVSAASLPLPSGAATAAKQPALGTAGTASADVITVQGAALMTALKVDGSATTQPVSGTVGVSGSVAVTGPLTDTQLRATALPVSGTVTTTPSGTQTVSGTVTANAGTGTFSVNQTQVGGVSLSTGNGTAGTGTQRVTIASDNTAFPVTANAGTGTFAVSAASLPLPAGASTEATLSSLNGKVTTVNTGAVTISSPLPAGTNALGTFSSIDVTASGSITAASQSVALALNGQSGATIQITGTWVGTLQFEGTVDGTNWTAINGVFAGTSTPGSTITANGIVRLTPSGLAQFRITSTAWTSGTATITLRASAATGGTFLNQSLTAGTNLIGKVGIDQTTPGTTNLVSIGTNGTVTANAGTGTFAVSGPLTDTQLRASAVPVSLTSTTVTGTVAVTAPTITKGTQGTNGFATQDLLDSGRVAKVWSATFTAAGTEALITLTPISDGTAAATCTSCAITSGKRLRLQSVCVSTRNVAAAAQGVVVSVRTNPGGATTASSSLILSVGAGTPIATANVVAANCDPIPDGYEILGNGTVTLGVSQIGTVTAGNTITLNGFEY